MSMPRPIYKDMNSDNFVKHAWDGDVLFPLSGEIPHGFTMDSWCCSVLLVVQAIMSSQLQNLRTVLSSFA